MKRLTKFLMLMIAVSTLSSCSFWVDVYTPRQVYNCYPVYDYWGYYLYDECYWEYYNDNGNVTKELDLVAEVADKEELLLEKTATHFAEKFNLSTEQGIKVAKNIRDYNTLQSRSAEDVADFAQKLYGVDPTEVVAALASAQSGSNAQLEILIEKASENFKTSKENMKSLIKDLHGRILSENGIQL